MNKEKELKLIRAFKDPFNWNPNLTKISKETGIPTTTVHDYWTGKVQRGKGFYPEIEFLITFRKAGMIDKLLKVRRNDGKKEND